MLGWAGAPDKVVPVLDTVRALRSRAPRLACVIVP